MNLTSTARRIDPGSNQGVPGRAPIFSKLAFEVYGAYYRLGGRFPSSFIGQRKLGHEIVRTRALNAFRKAGELDEFIYPDLPAGAPSPISSKRLGAALRQLVVLGVIKVTRRRRTTNLVRVLLAHAMVEDAFFRCRRHGNQVAPAKGKRENQDGGKGRIKNPEKVAPPVLRSTDPELPHTRARAREGSASPGQNENATKAKEQIMPPQDPFDGRSAEQANGVLRPAKFPKGQRRQRQANESVGQEQRAAVAYINAARQEREFFDGWGGWRAHWDAQVATLGSTEQAVVWGGKEWAQIKTLAARLAENGVPDRRAFIEDVFANWKRFADGEWRISWLAKRHAVPVVGMLLSQFDAILNDVLDVRRYRIVPEDSTGPHVPSAVAVLIAANAPAIEAEAAAAVLAREQEEREEVARLAAEESARIAAGGTPAVVVAPAPPSQPLHFLRGGEPPTGPEQPARQKGPAWQYNWAPGDPIPGSTDPRYQGKKGGNNVAR